MRAVIVLVVLLVVIVVAAVLISRALAERRQQRLQDAQAEARRWVERLGGQVLNLVGTDEASRQALADASERYTAAGSQMEQASSEAQCRLVTQTALEGLYYVRAARTAMGLDPGPELPDLAGAQRAGSVTEHREVQVDGHRYAASPDPDERTPYYYPGGQVAGRPVPRGWYSEPWWRPALVAGAWGLGSVLLFDAMFSGMAGIPSAGAWEGGYDAGQEHDAAGTGDGGSDWGGGGDSGGFDGGFV